MSFACTNCIIYDIEYFNNSDGVNSFYLIINDVDACIEEYNENKYLVFALTNKNKEALENYRELWDEIKNEIETIREIEPIKYEKDSTKIKFESNDNLPLGKKLDIPVCVIIVRSVFQKNSKYYPQVFLHERFCEYEYEDDSYVIV